MKIIQCVQGDAVWLEARHGKVTASRVADVLSRGVARNKYKMELLTEIITGRTAEHFVTPAMDWGIQNEPVARSVYEMRNGVEVDRIGLVLHPSIERGAASPDGLVLKHGLLEIKCPTTSTHLEYVLTEEIPDKYIPQMQWQMACTGREWCDFVSFDPRLPEDFSYFEKRLNRDEAKIDMMEAAVNNFIAEINEMCGKLLKHSGGVLPETMDSPGPGPERAHIPTLEGV